MNKELKIGQHVWIWAEVTDNHWSDKGIIFVAPIGHGPIQMSRNFIRTDDTEAKLRELRDDLAACPGQPELMATAVKGFYTRLTLLLGDK